MRWEFRDANRKGKGKRARIAGQAGGDDGGEGDDDGDDDGEEEGGEGGEGGENGDIVEGAGETPSKKAKPSPGTES